MTKTEAAKLKPGEKVKFKDGTLIFTIKSIKADPKGFRFGFEEMNIYPLHKKLERVTAD